MTPLTPTQAEYLRLFRGKVADLRHRSLLQRSETLELQIRPELPTGLSGVSEDELRALLALLRQFYLHKEPTTLDKISTIIKMECERPELCGWADHAMKGWKATLESKPLGIRLLHDHAYTVREAMDLLLYTQVIHADRTKSRILRPEDTITQGFLRQIVVVSLDRLCHCPVLIDRVIWHWLDAPIEPVPDVPGT